MTDNSAENILSSLEKDAYDCVRSRKPMIWQNPQRSSSREALQQTELGEADVKAAESRWERFAPLLAELFDGLNNGRIDSELTTLSPDLTIRIFGDKVKHALIKADHALPVTGCIKARGGIYEVLVYAEEVVDRAGLLASLPTYAALAHDNFRKLFSNHTIAVGSTGNLGFSVGIMGRALGFQVEVHMSHDAKAWKKERLREIGARVVEHSGDYGAAVAAARHAFANQTNAHFVDDEHSIDLFLGYATAARDLQEQLSAARIPVDAEHPLFVYLPCGVGGAPGGVSFGLTLLYGDAVRPILVEPVASPCMLVQLAAGVDRPVSVYDFGLDNRTEADGLAVAAASMFVARTVGPIIDAVVTVTDEEMLQWLRLLWDTAGMRLEPSAASGFAAAYHIAASTEPAKLGTATHVIWTTGGAHLPESEFQAALRRSTSE